MMIERIIELQGLAVVSFVALVVVGVYIKAKAALNEGTTPDRRELLASQKVWIKKSIAASRKVEKCKERYLIAKERSDYARAMVDGTFEQENEMDRRERHARGKNE